MGKYGQIRLNRPVVFSGSVANNEGVTKTFSKILGKKVTAIKNP